MLTQNIVQSMRKSNVKDSRLYKNERWQHEQRNFIFLSSSIT